jgi:hypothetical protein
MDANTYFQRPFVIPAKAGIQNHLLNAWIPAFTGMTLWSVGSDIRVYLRPSAVPIYFLKTSAKNCFIASQERRSPFSL